MNNICKQLKIQIGIREHEKNDLLRIQGDLKDECALKKASYHFEFFGNLTHEELQEVISDYNKIIQSKVDDIENLKNEFDSAGCSL